MLYSIISDNMIRLVNVGNVHCNVSTLIYAWLDFQEKINQKKKHQIGQ